MADSAAEAMSSFQRWSDAFNTRDVEGMVAEMHFPNRRLGGDNQFDAWETADAFRAAQHALTPQLEAEGWHHTSALAIEAVQAAPEKAHLVIRQSRRGADDLGYLEFDILWIFTRSSGRWGVQFRSSF